MREAPVPSYRVRGAASEGSSSRMMVIAGGLAAVVGVGALLGWGITRMTSNRPIPVVEAETRPVKIRPDDRGGLRVANQDEIIFERRGSGGAGFDASGRLAPAAEAPNLDALRAATTVPPAAAPRVAEAPAQPQAVPPGVPAAPVAAAPQPAAPAPVVPAAPAAPAPAPAVVAAPAAPRPSAAGGGVTVQLGALDSEAGARAEWERLTRRAPELLQGRSPQVIRFERQDKPTMWRLRTGGFSAETAKDFCDGIRGKGGACAVIGG